MAICQVETVEQRSVAQKEGTMVRVIIEHQTTPENVERIIDLIRELRNEAMKQPGYITGETLVNTEDTTNVLVISTWRSVKDWDAWDTCETRQKITQQIKPLLLKPYTVRIYRYHLTKENRVWSTF